MIGIGRAYSINFDNQTFANADGNVDIFSIVPAGDKICVIEALYLSNVGGTADAGDAQEELLRLTFKRMTATVTITGGTSFTAVPLSTNDAAAGFTAKFYHATVATTTGATSVLHADGWNIRIPYVWLPPPEHRPIVAVSTSVFVVRLESTVADDVACSGTLIVRELP
jgi:hypothetical protein